MNFHDTTGSYLDDRYTNILQWELKGPGWSYQGIKGVSIAIKFRIHVTPLVATKENESNSISE